MKAAQNNCLDYLLQKNAPEEGWAFSGLSVIERTDGWTDGISNFRCRFRGDVKKNNWYFLPVLPTKSIFQIQNGFFLPPQLLSVYL